MNAIFECFSHKQMGFNFKGWVNFMPCFNVLISNLAMLILHDLSFILPFLFARLLFFFLEFVYAYIPFESISCISVFVDKWYLVILSYLIYSIRCFYCGVSFYFFACLNLFF